MLMIPFLVFGQDKNSDKPIVSISVPSGVGIEISGEAEVEFINVEGKGGAQHEDDFLKKIETRSPYTQIDKTVLDFKLIYTDYLTYNFSARFDDDGAYADRHILQYKKNNIRIELGKNRPLIALKKNTEAYPLIGTAYWKGREYHLDIEREYSSALFGASISLKRPIGYDDALEDKSFRMLVYDDTQKNDGQTIELGFRGQYSLEPFKVQAWYYFGSLIDDADWKKRLHYDFDYYGNIEKHTVLNKDAYVGHFWFGGRAELTLFDALIRGEYIFSEDAFLPRDGFYFEVGRKLDFFSIKGLFGLVRYGQSRIDPYRLTDSFLNPYKESYDTALLENDDSDNERFSPMLKDPHTWDRELITLAMSYKLSSYAQLRLEYYILDEDTGDTKENSLQQNRRFQPSVDDDQLLIQLRLSF